MSVRYPGFEVENFCQISREGVENVCQISRAGG
jgi:hypothetical protein